MSFESKVKNVNRQWPLYSVTRVTFEDLEDTVAKALTELPGNAVVVDGGLNVQTAWDSGTTATIDIGDADDPDRYFAAVNLAATGYTAASITGDQMDVPTEVTGTLAEDGTAAEAGEALLIIGYVVEGRGGEVH